LIGPLENGGLKLQDLETKIKSLKLKWISKMIADNEDLPWKSYLESFFKEPINRIPYYNIKDKDYPNFRQPFYTELFNTWSSLHFTEPNETIGICEQQIWNNSLIKIGGKMVNYKSWKDKGIIFIQQLIDQKGKILSKEVLENKFDIDCLFLQFESLIHAIPKKWKIQMADDNISSNLQPYLKCYIHYSNEKKDIGSTDTREVYWHFIESISQRPTSEKTWLEKTELNLSENEWEIVYKMPYGITRDTTILAIHYKITHRIIACNYQLKIWKVKDTDKCDFCEEIDTIEHFFVTCKRSKTFWEALLKWWEIFSKTTIPLNIFETIFGIPNEEKNIVVSNLNYFLIHGNYYIYRCKKKCTDINLYDFLLECKNNLEIEQKIMVSKDKEDEFNARWEICLTASVNYTHHIGSLLYPDGLAKRNPK
jgi:hypothetical protein